MTSRATTIAALLLAGAGIAGGLAAAASSDTGADRQAASSAREAGKALAKRKADKAVAAAEAAVALAPRTAAYRTLLGQAYLGAGRFASAAAALSDALALDPSDGTAALHLALAQVANGDWNGARSTLALHESRIAAADRGLALALAGDPATAVTILTAAARAPDADAKTRQNLALSLALAGRWPEAKTVAALDVSPADVDRRILQWASFAQPRAASDQVATLLGVTPIADAGQPARLALRDTAPSVAAIAQPVAAAVAYVTEAAPAAEEKPVVVAQPDTPPVIVSTPAPVAAPAMVAAPVVITASATSFGPRSEVVQAIAFARTPKPTLGLAPVKAAWPAAKVAAKPVSATKAPARGTFHVQLGAFENAGVARVAWSRLSRRTMLSGLMPSTGQVAHAGRNFYRLSVGGFARADADRLCAKVRFSGGHCFVRAAAGDAVAQWASRGVQLASR